MLLLKGANPNIVNKSGISPIIVARRNCQDRIVDVLEKHGAILPVYEEKNAKRYGGVGGAGDDAAIASTAGGASTSKKTKNDHSTSSNSNSNNITITPLAQRISVPKKQQEEVNAKIQIIKGPNERRPNIYKFCRAKRLPCHQAAYLGLSDLLVDVVSEDSEVNSADEQNCSPLMKAAYHGHLTIVNYLLSKGVEVDALDQDGNTALVWACLGGHLDVVKSLIQVGKAHVDGYFRKSASTAVTISMLHKSTLALPSNTFPPSSSASAAHRREASTDSDAVTSNRFYNAITPLVAAVYENQLEIVNFLLVQNADLNTKIGIMTGGGKTAIMIACWMLHFPIVDLLLTSGATVDAQSSEWIKKGVISVKRAQLDQNPWRSADIVTTLASSPISGFSPSPGVTESPTALDRESLKEKMAYLSAEDVNSIAKVVQLISSIGSTISPQSTIPSVEEEIDSRTTLRKKKNVRRSSFLRQAINLEVKWFWGGKTEMCLNLSQSTHPLFLY